LLEDRTLLNGTTLLVQLKPGLDAGVFGAPTTSNLLAGADFQATRIDGLFQLNVDDAKLSAVTSLLRNNYSIAYADPQTTYRVDLTPNDPNYTNGALFGLGGTFGINAPLAWDTTTGTTTPVVAVIDTGVDYRHVDLFRNIWLNQGEIPANIRAALVDLDGDGIITFWDLNDSRNQGAGKITDLDADGRITGADLLRNTSQGGWADGADTNADGFIDDLVGWDFVNNDNNPFDDHNHGTHVSGTIGAIGNNSTGVVGVNWKVQIMGLKFLDASGSGNDANAATAIRYAADHGSQISNNSWGGGGFSNTLNSAIAYAAGLDHLFVAAAGNNGANTDVNVNYPSGYNQPNIISVAATTSSGALASFSNYGATTVDLGAPGESIYSTLPNNSYAYFSGTSMATPHVAGAAALLLARTPSLTYGELKDRLLSTTTPLASLAGKTVTGGLLNVGNAIQNGPEISVLDGANNLTDGTSTVDFGSTFTSIPVSKTITVRNAGNQTLTLNNPITLPAGFTLTSGFGTLSLAPGAATTFTIRLDATVNGTYAGQISFASNDANESPFNFTITGSVGNVSILDNGATGFSTVGAWTQWTNQGYQSDIHEALAGNGSDVATWAFNVGPGQYAVAATWSSFSNRASNSPFSILDGTSNLATVAVNQQLSPNDFNDSGASWENLGTYTVTGNILTIKLANNANGRLNADAIRVERLAATPASPEIQVLDGTTDLADGVAVVNFGSTAPGTPISKTFTLKNVGTQNLTLGALTIPAGFTIASGFGAATLTPGSSTTFTVRLDAATVGSYSGQLSFVNNDADESPFNFTIQGSVAATPVVTIIDNGDAGFTTAGSWTAWSGQGYQNDVHEAFAGNGSTVATWTFSVAPGQYRVAATWSAFSNRATNSPFNVFDGSTSLGTVQANQQLAPADFVDSGASWSNLGTYTISGGSLVVKLANNANGNLNADAIRIERIGATPSGPEIQVLDGVTDVVDGAAVVSFGSTPPGTPISKIFTVKNIGNQDLNLGAITVPAGFTVTSGFGTTILTPGSATTITVRLNAAVAGSYSGQLSFGNNDADENPFNFTIQGTVAAAPVVAIIDNGDAGFSTTGSWTAWSGQGYQGDVHEAFAGDGSAVATWTFNVVPGQYRVSATWSAFSNRATNSPYTVYDGATQLAAVPINQQESPGDFTANGVAWEDIATVTIVNGTLVVKLANNANGRLNADAIRIEKIG